MRETLVKTEEFKDSPLGKIPKDWEVFKLSEVVPRAEYGISVSLDDEVGIPVLRMNNLKDGEVDLTDLKKSASFKAASLLLQPLDVLFNRTNSIEHVGRTAIWRGQIEQTSFASYLVRLIPEQSKLIPEYLNIWLNFPSTQLLIRRYATPGVHQVNINPTNLRKVLIALPKEVSEQRRIVEILGSMDEAIAHTSSLIAKLKQMKAGLLHDLLTRGLDENGELRDAIGHPEQFKDSLLGRIPKDWEVESLDTVCLNVVDCPHTTPVFRTEGVLVARTSNIRDGIFDVPAASYISEQEYRQRITRLEPQLGDIVFTREAPVGEAFVIPECMRICLGQRTMLLRPSPEKAHPGYLLAQIYSGAVRVRINQLVGGTTNPHLNVGEVRSFLLPVPPLREQAQIASVLDAHNNRIRAEEAYRDKLNLQKQGLMHDLLTGKVRVKNA